MGEQPLAAMNYTGWCHCSCSRKRTAGPTGEQHSIVDRAREPVLAALAAAAAARAGPPPPPPPARGNVGGSSARLIAQCCADMSSCGSGSLPASSSITNGSSPFMVSLRRGDGGHGMHSIPSREGLRGDPPPRPHCPRNAVGLLQGSPTLSRSPCGTCSSAPPWRLSSSSSATSSRSR